MKSAACILFSLALMAASSCQEVRSVKVKVTEEVGTPIEGAKVTVTFLGHRAEQTTKKTGETDGGGVFKAKGSPPLRMSVRIEKAGYYLTSSGRLSRKTDHDLIFVLRKMEKPIPLHAKRLQTVAPVLEKEFSYDLEVGDWVPPHGKGKVKDLVFVARSLRNNDSSKDYHDELNIGFSNANDGFIRFSPNNFSAFRSPYYRAPEDEDYKKSWLYFKRRAPGEGTRTNGDPNRGYIFRLRSKVDETGKLVSCHYAKAYGDFPDIRYYFNPTPNDRNLEFDPKKNLFKKLDSTERVHDP